jgi:hypothetical protein
MKSAETREGAARISAWLASVPAGRACALFAEVIDDGVAAVGELGTHGDSPPTIVTLEWNRLPRLSQELSKAAAALADATLTLHPALYMSSGQRQLDKRWDGAERELDAEATERRVSGAIPSVVNRIFAECRQRRRPRLRDLPLADEVRQLALALDPAQLVVLLVIRAEEWSEATLLPLARGAEWLATNTAARVVLVLPARLLGHASLDSVTYRSLSLPDSITGGEDLAQNGPDPRPVGSLASTRVSPVPHRERRPLTSDVDIEFPDASSESDDATQDPSVSVSPILGHPHPGSEPELILHRRITSDAELSPLFQYNQVVKTEDGHTPRVDVVWTKGRLAIEIDAHALHSRRRAFFQDRLRDYRLIASGWRVWRIDDQEIIMDAERVVEKLRKLVRILGKEES